MVKKSTVLKLMRIIEHAGIQARSKYRLIRRQYSVPAPNYLWHIDGFDKLKTFGLAISGHVDGFSQQVIWLIISMTNYNPKVISNYFLKALLEQECMSTLIRSDCGTENLLMEVRQKALRYNHTYKFASHDSYRYGTSTANE